MQAAASSYMQSEYRVPTTQTSNSHCFLFFVKLFHGFEMHWVAHDLNISYQGDAKIVFFFFLFFFFFCVCVLNTKIFVFTVTLLTSMKLSDGRLFAGGRLLHRCRI